MFEGFEEQLIDVGDVKIRIRRAGAGRPLLLLHGYPQTLAIWHGVAPKLAEEFTVIAADLTGYGGSSKPPTTPGHERYSKRAMARDQVAMMEKLGFEQFAVAGHDRGGRVAYRMALDFPDRVSKLAVLDIVPAADAFSHVDLDFALGYWHWLFLAQPAPLPERIIAAAPDAFFYRQRNAPWLDPEALAEYVRFTDDPETIHAMCEDYRAGVSCDLQLDNADRGKLRIQCPVLALWGKKGNLEKRHDVLATWRVWANQVSGRGLDCGHSLPEESPGETYEELKSFFRS